MSETARVAEREDDDAGTDPDVSPREADDNDPDGGEDEPRPEDEPSSRSKDAGGGAPKLHAPANEPRSDDRERSAPAATDPADTLEDEALDYGND